MSSHPNGQNNFSEGFYAHNLSSVHVQGTAFTFRKRRGQIDWRKLASIDVDRIAKEMDFQALQQNIMNVTFCNIEAEEFQNLDRNFIKLFRLSQLIIEYLLHSQQYLSSQTMVLEQKLQQILQDQEKTAAEIKLREKELKVVKKENRKRRKVIAAYQDMINAGATGLHACPVCKREFVSGEYLQAHINRRHPDNSKNNIKEKQENSQKEIEARLMEHVTEHLLASEQQLREEMQQKETESVNLHIKQFDEWKEQERNKMTIELEKFKIPVMSELEDLRQQKAQLEKMLHEKEVEVIKLQEKRQSHLGHLEGAKELFEASQLNESKAQIIHLKESLETQMQEMQATLKEQDKSLKRQIKELSSSQHNQLAESGAKLEAAEHKRIENSTTDKKVTKKLKILQQKMKQQEDLLQSQQDQLLNLQSSPMHSIHSPQKDTQKEDSHEEDPGVILSLLQLQSEVDSESDTNDHVDLGSYTPFSHRPMIKTRYPHTQEDMEKIRRQTEAIFHDTLIQKGLIKDANGLNSIEYEKQMNLLHQERKENIEAHYHFAEHRQKLAQKIDEHAAMNFKPEEFLHLISSQKEKKSASAAVSNTSKPPKPIPNVILQEDPVDPSMRDVTSVEQDYPSNESLTDDNSSEDLDSSDDLSDDIQVPVSKLDTTDDEQLDDNDAQANNETVAITVQHPAAGKVQAPTMNDNPWDSEDDSIEELVNPYKSKTSSTPIKVLISNDQPKTKNDGTVQDDDSLDTFDLSSSDPPPPTQPSKDTNSLDTFDLSSNDPPPPTQHLKVTDSLDTFDLSSSDPPPPTQPSKVITVIKPQSRTVTSQSALTSVSMDDFDSDFSDLDL